MSILMHLPAHPELFTLTQSACAATVSAAERKWPRIVAIIAIVRSTGHIHSLSEPPKHRPKKRETNKKTISIFNLKLADFSPSLILLRAQCSGKRKSRLNQQCYLGREIEGERGIGFYLGAATIVAVQIISSGSGWAPCQVSLSHNS